jgi:hypothetical protein
LAHHALGRLILEAVGLNLIDLLDDAFVRSDVFQAAYLARRLLEQGQMAEARRVLSLIRRELVRFPPDVPPGYLGSITQLFVDVKAADHPELETEFLSNIARFPSGRIPIVGLSGFFGFSRDRMPRLYAAAVARLQDPAVMAAITESYVDAPATAIMSMVNVSANHGLPFTDALLAPLRDPDVLDMVAVNLIGQTWSDLDDYLIANAIYDPVGRDLLVQKLRRSGRLRSCGEAFVFQPFQTIQRVIFEHPTAAALLLSEIDVEQWRNRDWAADVGLGETLAFSLKNLEKLGRSDLAGELARQAVERREAAMWTPAKKAGRRLVAICHRAGAVAPEAFARLAEHLGTRNWLAPIYNRMSPDDLVTILIRLWHHAPPDVFRHFRTDGLGVELARRLRPAALRDSRGAERAIQAAGLLRVLQLPLPAGIGAPAPFSPPAEGSAETFIYWIGYAALSKTAPDQLADRPWTRSDLLTLPTWVATELRTVERWRTT